MSFSASDAAFEGFRQVRRHPLAVIFWAAAYIVVLSVGFVVAGPLVIDVAARLQSLQGTEPNMAEVEPLFQSYGRMLVLITPLALLLGAVLNAAIARSVVRPAEKAFGYLRLGADELRVLGVSVILWIVISLAWFVGSGITMALGAMAYAMGLPLLWIGVVLLGLASIAVIIWLSVRLSLAVPIVVAERRFAVFDSFALTKGRFWPLLGMAIIAVVMTMLVSMLGGIVAMPVTALIGGSGGLPGLEGLTVAAILQKAGPMIVSWIVVNSLLSALQLAVLYAPFSAAYRDIKGLPHA